MNKNCSDQRIEKYIFDELESNEEYEFEEHLLQCEECYRKMRQLNESKNIIDNLDAPAGLEEIKELISTTRKEKSSTERSKQKWLFLPSLGRSLRYVSYAVVVLFISTAILLTFKFSGVFKSGMRGIDTEIKYLHPINGESVGLPLTFEWSKIKRAQYYIFELFDSKMIDIYQSNKITDNIFTLPAEMIIKMEKNKLYYWKITAISKEGAAIKSESKAPSRFKLLE